MFSVIINCFNSEAYIETTLASVLEQSFRDFEVIIWDNMSTDNTVRLIKKFNDNRIKLFQAKNHTSLGLARNEAIGRATQNYLAFIDSDDLWATEKLGIYKKYLDEQKGRYILYSDTYFIDKNGLRLGRMHEKRRPSNRPYNLILRYNISLETIVMPRSLVVDYDLKFRDYSIIEEFDFVVRAFLLSGLQYIPLPLSSWRIHNAQLSQTSKKEYPMEIIDWSKSWQGPKLSLYVAMLQYLGKFKLIELLKTEEISLSKSDRKKYVSTVLYVLTPLWLVKSLKKLLL